MDFSGYKYISLLLVLSEIVILILAYRRKPKLAFIVVVLSIALKGQYLWVGRPVYAWQIAALIGLAVLALSKSDRAKLRPGRMLSVFKVAFQLYWIYALALSVLMWIMFNSEAAVSPTRILTQVIYFFFVIGLFGFGMRSGKYLTTFDLIRTLAIIATVVAYFALLQVGVLRWTGINLFPIIGSDDTIRSAYILGQTFRATSFAGEPKHLGILMSVGLTAFYLARLFRIRIGGRFAFHAPLAMISALLMSLSTTGIALTAVGVVASSILFFTRLRMTDIIVAAFAAMAVLHWYSGTDATFQDALDRQLSKSDIEVQDMSVREALLANPELIPTGTGLGNIHLIAVDYLPENFPLFRDGGYKANSGLFFVLGDSGVIGLLLLVSAPVFALQAYLKDRQHFSGEARKEGASALALLFLTYVSFLLRYDVFIFLFAGFIYARLSILRAMALDANITVGQPMLKRDCALSSTYN